MPVNQNRWFLLRVSPGLRLVDILVLNEDHMFADVARSVGSSTASSDVVGQPVAGHLEDDLVHQRLPFSSDVECRAPGTVAPELGAKIVGVKIGLLMVTGTGTLVNWVPEFPLTTLWMV